MVRHIMHQERIRVSKGRTIAAAPSRTFLVGIIRDVLLPFSLIETLFVLQAVSIVVPPVVVEAGLGRIRLAADVAGEARSRGSLPSQTDIVPSAVKCPKGFVHGDAISLWTRSHAARGSGGWWQRRWLNDNPRRQGNEFGNWLRCFYWTCLWGWFGRDGECVGGAFA
jgi:hypothetical protein